MFPYYLLIIFPFFVECVDALLHSNQQYVFAVKRSNFSIVVFFLVFFLMLALRSIECGSDLINYELFFYHAKKIDFKDIFVYYPIEQLYFSFNWFFAHLYPDFRFFLVVTACLCSLSVGWFYWKESEFAPLTILLFVTNAPFVMFFSGLRQAIAMLFVIPAYYLTQQKKIILFILIVLIASYFHTSAMVMLLMYPIFHIPLKSKHFVIAMGLVSCFFLFNTQIFNNILPFLGERYMDRYGVIQETSGYGMWLFFIFFLILSFLIPDDRKMTHEISGLRNILVLTTLIQSFAPIHNLAMRMNYYFILLFPIIIPKILNRPKKGWENVSQFVKWSFVLLLTFVFFYKIHFTSCILKAWPYIAYWE